MVESLKSPARRVPLAWCKVAAQKKQEEAALLPGCRILKKLSILGWNPGHSFPIPKGDDPTGRQTGGKQRKNALVAFFLQSSYHIIMLQEAASEGLVDWLSENGYHCVRNADPALLIAVKKAHFSSIRIFSQVTEYKGITKQTYKFSLLGAEATLCEPIETATALRLGVCHIHNNWAKEIKHTSPFCTQFRDLIKDMNLDFLYGDFNQLLYKRPERNKQTVLPELFPDIDWPAVDPYPEEFGGKDKALDHAGTMIWGRTWMQPNQEGWDCTGFIICAV